MSASLGEGAFDPSFSCVPVATPERSFVGGCRCDEDVPAVMVAGLGLGVVLVLVLALRLALA